MGEKKPSSCQYFGKKEQTPEIKAFKMVKKNLNIAQDLFNQSRIFVSWRYGNM